MFLHNKKFQVMNFVFQVACFVGSLSATHQQWQLCSVQSTPTCVTTTVTRSVHEALFSAGVIPDPIFGSNDDAYRSIATKDWVFTTTIEGAVSDDLHFSYIGGHGSEIYIDDKLVIGPIKTGSFEPVSVRIDSPIGKKNFILRIVLKSTVNAAESLASQLRDSQVPKCPPEAQHGFCGVEYLRIPQYGFGWDWGPGFGSVGFELNLRFAARKKIFVETKMKDGVWNLGLLIEGVIMSGQVAKVSVFNETFSWSQKVFPVDKATLKVDVSEHVCSWFPDNPCLYNITVCFSDQCFEKPEIGFRQVEIRQVEIRQGIDSPVFLLNEKEVFIRGTNLIPTGPYSAPPSDSEIDLLFSEILASGLNLVRIWGGGFYGSDHLYSMANRHGIMIWEELKFACASYPFENEAFRETAISEIRSQFRRIHSNPSLVIISGDNEVNQMLEANWYGAGADQLRTLKAEYKKMRKNIDTIVNFFWPKETKQVAFIPTSPFDGVDTHFYDYSGDCRDVRKYTSTGIVSEYGFQSFCDWDSCLSKVVHDAETVGKEKAIDSEFLRHRQHRATGMRELENQVVLLMNDVKSPSVESFVWYSLISQAVCLKASTESFRRNPNVSGVMYWQFNDVWPGASWSTIDYYGHRKPSWFFTKSSFAKNFISVFVDAKNELVVLLVGARTMVEIPNSLLVVDILSGKYEKFPLPSTSAGVELFRKPVIFACPSGTCVAALSKTNYILIGSPDRSRHQHGQLVYDPISVESQSDGKTSLLAKIPSPFIFVSTEENLETNLFFLAPIDGWDQVDVAGVVTNIKTYWSFLEEDTNRHDVNIHFQVLVD